MEINSSEEILQSVLEQFEQGALNQGAVIITRDYVEQQYYKQNKDTLFSVIQKLVKEEGSLNFFILLNGVIVILKDLPKDELFDMSRQIIFALQDTCETPEDVDTSQIQYYDFKVDWQRFKDTCFEHIVACREIRQKQAQSKIDYIPTVEDLKDSRQESIRTLSMKRNSRTLPMIQFAEDDPAISFLLTKLVGKRQLHSIITSSDGVKAVEQYLDRAPDILFLDIGMPKLNGLEVLKIITELDEDAFVVMLTADSSHGTVQDCIKHKAKGYITKPFTKGKLDSYLDKYHDWRHKV